MDSCAKQKEATEMFTNTAYEALYQYLGLALHSQFIEIITSEGFFKAVVLMIFGILFFSTAVKFLSRYVPGSLMAKRHVPLTAFIKIIACLFLGLALLKVGSSTSVKSYSGDSWHSNPYVQTRYGEVKEQIKVSFVFDLLSRTAEESSALLNRIVDNVMAKSHSQLGAPNFFYKAIMYSGSATINSPEITELIHFYTEECFQKVLPLIGGSSNGGNLSEFFVENGGYDQKLSEIDIKTQGSGNYTCLDVKNEVRSSLKQHAKNHHVRFLRVTGGKVPRVIEGDEAWENMHMANMLVNHYLDEKESVMGIMKGSQVKGTTGRIFQYLNRLFSFDAVLSLFGFSDTHGSSEAAVRSQKFSEHLARAPHVAGILKMVLIFVFPFLMFFIVAGKWRVLAYWFALYTSVLLWAPLWTLFYHIMTSMAQSVEMMEAIGELSDGVSLYGAKLVSSRIYYFYSIYSWIQIMIGVLTTGGMFYFIRPLLTENSAEKAPEFLGGASDTASTAGTLASTGSKVIGAL